MSLPGTLQGHYPSLHLLSYMRYRPNCKTARRSPRLAGRAARTP
jgi:hypothetical protein